MSAAIAYHLVEGGISLVLTIMSQVRDTIGDPLVRSENGGSDVVLCSAKVAVPLQRVPRLAGHLALAQQFPLHRPAVAGR